MELIPNRVWVKNWLLSALLLLSCTEQEEGLNIPALEDNPCIHHLDCFIPNKMVTTDVLNFKINPSDQVKSLINDGLVEKYFFSIKDLEKKYSDPSRFELNADTLSLWFEGKYFGDEPNLISKKWKSSDPGTIQLELISIDDTISIRFCGEPSVRVVKTE